MAVLMRDKHVKFFKRCLQVLPASCGDLFDRKPMTAFFSVCGLDILDALQNEQIIGADFQDNIIDWVYSLLCINEKEGTAGFIGGFRISDPESEDPSFYDMPNLGMTYTSLAILFTLGDDMRKVPRRAILAGLAKVQQADGSFSSQEMDGDIDMRFVYCAVCVCYMLNDFTTIDLEGCVSYIMSCQTYEGGFSCTPEAEAHGGSTFCAVASLALLGRLECLEESRRRSIVEWLLFRQETGFNGRPHKLVDTCYSFWVGGALEILGAFHFTDPKLNREHILDTQCSITGGLGKVSGTNPDLLHAYLGLSGLSFIERDDLPKVHAPLNITERAYERVKAYRVEHQ